MTVAELRHETNLSQREFARLFDIPVRTLQQWEQGKSAPAPYVISMMEQLLHRRSDKNESTGEKHFTLPEKTRWKICIEEPFMNCDRIYPIQQRKVKELVDNVSHNPAVKSITIFGSSTTQRCHAGSDVDVFIDADEPVDLRLQPYDFVCDVWTNHTADERLMAEILRTGVVVYDACTDAS